MSLMPLSVSGGRRRFSNRGADASGDLKGAEIRAPSSAGVDCYESSWAGPAPIPMGRGRGEQGCRDPGPVGDYVLPAGPVELKVPPPDAPGPAPDPHADRSEGTGRTGGELFGE
jgi:hypothetical protein